jgi:aspartyl protease family protein
LAPTLVASRTTLPPGGARFALGRPGGETMAPTLVASRTTLPPEGALRLRTGKAGSAALAGMGWRYLTVLLIALAAFSGMAHAQSVALAGMLGNKALLVVNGAPPKSVAVGEKHMEVKVISTSGDQAVLELNGKRHTLRVGDAPVSVGAGGGSGGEAGKGRGGNRIVLTAGTGGHFLTPGQINGRTVQFLVDTGATSISMTVTDAERMGLAYTSGQRVQLSTANGVVPGWRISLASVRVGDVEVFNVDAVVAARDMPFLLLGNSFLTRFQMIRENDQLTLVKRF